MKKSADFIDLLSLDDVEGILGEQLPDPGLLEYYRRLKDREILWNDDVDESMIEVSMCIRKWNIEDKGKSVDERKPIKIFINSDGGDLNTIMNVVDMIELSKTPVITIALGKAYSAGGLLLMAGDMRYIFKNTSCLIHDGSSGIYGTTGKMLDNLEFTKGLERRIRDYIISHTDIPDDLYDSNYRRDWFLFSDEMIRYNVADEIIEDIDLIC